MKTIKQISDELGVDKQKVYRYIKKNHIKEVHQECIGEALQKMVRNTMMKWVKVL